MENPQTFNSQQHPDCPLCELGTLRPLGHDSARCDSCASLVGGPILETLRNIASLPDAVGAHACECGHPEMRRLPDDVYRCPACGAEVVPISAESISWTSDEHSAAYWSGWLDGRYKYPQLFTTNSRLAKWEDAEDRLDYYRGHRAGHDARLRKINHSTRNLVK